MFSTSKIVLTITLLLVIFRSGTSSHAQEFAVYISGSDSQAVEILGSMLDNKIGQNGWNVKYSIPVNMPYVSIYVAPVQSGWGYSQKNWGISSSILYDVTRYFDSYFYVPSVGYNSNKGTNAHYIILSFKIDKPESTLTYFSGGMANDQYKSSSFYASSYYNSGYSSENFGADYWSRFIAAEEIVPQLNAELAQITMPAISTDNQGCNQTTVVGPPATSGYTSSPAPQPRSNIEFSDNQHNLIEYDQLVDGDTIDFYSDTGAIQFSPGAGSIFITPSDQTIGYLQQSYNDSQWNLPETKYEIKKKIEGKYFIVIEEVRYNSRTIKTINLNFLKDKIKNEEIKF